MRREEGSVPLSALNSPKSCPIRSRHPEPTGVVESLLGLEGRFHNDGSSLLRLGSHPGGLVEYAFAHRQCTAGQLPRRFPSKAHTGRAHRVTVLILDPSQDAMHIRACKREEPTGSISEHFLDRQKSLIPKNVGRMTFRKKNHFENADSLLEKQALRACFSSVLLFSLCDACFDLLCVSLDNGQLQCGDTQLIASAEMCKHVETF